ncbi:uncharacterized protein LOC121383502 [Gigantopelta aegis]|uniref:uncharacterized protein LOC121383502 n=1 Tax=Gigantopelta aegis TaxID=1735272 RepID=UPI001B88914B|nr:uncharacterized protein LOC121383502 [Gigantopelta aegis]
MASENVNKRKLKCLIHHSGKVTGKLTPFSSTSWLRLTECAKRWLECDSESEENAISKILNEQGFVNSLYNSVTNFGHLGYHRSCYQRFTNSQHIERALRAVPQPDSTDMCPDPSSSDCDTSYEPPRKLRSASNLQLSASTTLPAICIICKRTDRFVKLHHKRTRDKLIQAETMTAGKLYEAAVKKCDESILLHIREKDCVAIEVKYHRTCYRDYTRFVTTKMCDRSDEDGLQFAKAYELYCTSVIETRMIRNKEILRMSNLIRLFHHYVQKHEGIDPSSYRYHVFKMLQCDQAIEQTVSRDSKTKGGVTGFTLNSGAVQRWILAQPQRSAITRQCEMMAGVSPETRPCKDNDATRIKKDKKAITLIMDTINSMINLFDNQYDELVCLSSGVIADRSVSLDLKNAYAKGDEASANYMKERLISKKGVDMFAPIKNLKLKTFGDQKRQKQNTKAEKVAVLKNDRALFARLLVIAQTRKIDLREILTYSLGSISLPLASMDGSLAKTSKSALLDLVEKKAEDCLVTLVPSNSAIILDAMAVLQSLQHIPETFGELADKILDLVISIASRYKCRRVDFVADQYPDICIKNAERARRTATSSGTQITHIYSKAQKKTPHQWKHLCLLVKIRKHLLPFFFLVGKKETTARCKTLPSMSP